jgi:excisionase family DNA binding protein
MCQSCKEKDYQLDKLRAENLVLSQRIGVMTIQLDALRAGNNQLKFFTVEEVADYLKVSAQTVKRYITSGKLSAVQIEKGGAYRINYSELMKFIVSNTVEKLEVCEC